MRADKGACPRFWSHSLMHSLTHLARFPWVKGRILRNSSSSMTTCSVRRGSYMEDV